MNFKRLDSESLKDLKARYSVKAEDIYEELEKKEKEFRSFEMNGNLNAGVVKKLEEKIEIETNLLKLLKENEKVAENSINFQKKRVEDLKSYLEQEKTVDMTYRALRIELKRGKLFEKRMIADLNAGWSKEILNILEERGEK